MAERLDSPPPSPVFDQPRMKGLSSMGGSQLMPMASTSALTPEMVQGIVQTSREFGEWIGRVSGTTPDLLPEWQKVEEALQEALAKLLIAGRTAGALPSEPGPGFPGGGFGRGAA